ncbi:MAG: O-antigen ligase family protein [Candidatus Omnitrophota bacterium]|nr:O-antigen ligase family protein [Candidatus Omnitrophota bacterium]MDZ4241392.1 O-antigen ligase family protein [Candidatus Omnitrophota bacterium]
MISGVEAAGANDPTNTMTPQKLILTLDRSIFVLLCALVFWLPYSKAAIEVCVILSLILWIVKRTVPAVWSPAAPTFGRKALDALKALNPPFGFAGTAVWLFLGACVFSVLGSVYPERSWHGFVTKTLEWFVIFFLVADSCGTRRRLGILLAVFLVTSLATALDSLFQVFVSGRDIFFGNQLVDGFRATAAFNHSNSLGAYWAGAVPVIFSLLMTKSKKLWHYGLFILICILVLWSLLLTYSRGAWLATLAGMVVFAAISGKRGRVILIAGFVAVIVTGLAGNAALRKNSRVDAPMISTAIGWRANLWRDSWEMVRERPVFGHGINTFMPRYEEYVRTRPSRLSVGFQPTYAHNCYVQLTVETGLAGLVLFLGIVFQLFMKAAKTVAAATRAPSRHIIAGAAAGMAAFLMHSAVDTNFYSLQLSAFFWLMAGGLVSAIRLADTQQTR